MTVPGTYNIIVNVDEKHVRASVLRPDGSVLKFVENIDDYQGGYDEAVATLFESLRDRFDTDA